MKKTLSFILIFTFVFACIGGFGAHADQVTARANSINGVRGEGALVIYTPAMGATTQTNQYGVEAVIGADNAVISVGGNDNAIPEGGFVLSAHDADDGSVLMKTWLIENIHEGDFVYYNRRSLIVTVSPMPLGLTPDGFYDLEVAYSNINSTRTENSIIIYEPSFGPTTRTNEYGFEAVVEDGRVTSVGGNNSAIPKNGFVISAHGNGAKKISDVLSVGMTVEVNRVTKTMLLTYDAESLEIGLMSLIGDAKAKLKEANDEYLYIDYAAIEAKLAAASARLKDISDKYALGKNDEIFIGSAEALREELMLLLRQISESYTVQYRAVWLRPSQKNAEEVDAYVKLLHENGINAVCVEGNYDNMVIMNVPEGCLFEHNYRFDFDVLQAYIDACHKYGMECHLWMSVCLIGNSNQSSFRRSVAYKKPEWVSLDQNGEADNDYHFRMVDPANAEAREYLISFYTYILQNYDIDCFQLDYIRYYDRTWEKDFGYTSEAFKGFEEAYHRGVTPTYNTEAAYWNDWVQFRKDSVTKLVSGIREVIDTYKPSCLLSADVVPSISGAGANNYQDYPEWMRQSLLDILHPMAYVDGYGDDIKEQVRLGGDRCMVVTGLGVFKSELGADDMARQACDDNFYGACGEAYFEAATYLSDKAGETLIQTVYRNDAVTPFLDRDEAIKLQLEYMSGRASDVMLSLGGLTKSECENLISAINNASAGVKDARIAPEAYASLKEAVAKVADEKARAVLENDLKRIERISCITYKVSSDKLTAELSLPVGEEFPEHTEPYAPAESSVPEESEVPVSSNVPSEEVSEAPSSPDKEGGNAWIFIIIALLVVAAAVTAVVIIRKNKGK